MRRGWQVRVAESLGPQRVQIPNVLGQSERAAEINIRRRGLELRAIAVMNISNTAAGQVLAQSPPPNASGVSAPKISLLVTQAPPPQAFVMPSFVGQPLGSVSQALQDAGMRLGTATAAAEPPASSLAAAVSPPANPSSPASIVVSQDPAAGQKVIVGSTVNFELR